MYVSHDAPSMRTAHMAGQAAKPPGRALVALPAVLLLTFERPVTTSVGNTLFVLVMYSAPAAGSMFPTVPKGEGGGVGGGAWLGWAAGLTASAVQV